jgi:hypothetical protein
VRDQQVRTRRPAARTAVLGVALAVLLGGCSIFGQDDETDGVSVFDVEAGQCFRVPEEITVELTELPAVPCTEPHEQEAYARVAYTDPATGKTPDTFPGADALSTFADGTCAEQFADYVGVDYRDSSLYFTYLVPSPRGWEQNADRDTVCFVTTTGSQLSQSVAGTGW